jgi:acyl-CoA synthetase (AMP-forming)/AMP-acid ligase II
MAVLSPDPRGYAGNLGLLFAEHAQADRPAIIDLRDPARPQPVSFRELEAGCNALARGLVRAGLKPGDRIGILSLNRAEFVVTLLGAMRVGVVPVPVNVKLSKDTVSTILKDAGARMVFAERDVKRLVPAGMRVEEFEGDYERFLDPGPFKAFEPTPDSVAIQPYTSGSTGRPKGVLLSHYGQNWSRRILAHTRGTTEKDVILVAAPLYHKNALNAIKQGLTAGATLPLMPQFDIERYIETIGRYRCTVISGVPTMMAMMLTRKDQLAGIDKTSVRTIMMGSAPSSPQLITELRAQFPNAEPLVVYGVTEGGPVPLGPHPEGKPRDRIARRALRGRGRLVDGGVRTRGTCAEESAPAGYHNLPEETAKRCATAGTARRRLPPGC